MAKKMSNLIRAMKSFEKAEIIKKIFAGDEFKPISTFSLIFSFFDFSKEKNFSTPLQIENLANSNFWAGTFEFELARFDCNY